MEISTERLILRDFIETDYPFYYALETHPHTLKYEKDVTPSLNEIESNFEKLLETYNQTNKRRISLLITLKTTLEPIGRIVTWEINQDIREWEIGWFIMPEYLNKGYATEAATVLRDFLFYVIQIHRLQALCHIDNKSSERVMIKLNMTKEGILRQSRKLHNEWVDMLIYSYLDSDLNK